jgi:catechol 2,3-dioxygenase-like lactoylglutathione lyase family enzyme
LTVAIPAITGVLETSLYVDDLDHAARFYQQLFGFSVMIGDERIRALAVCPGQVLLLFKRGASLSEDQFPTHDGSGPLHLAFSIPENEFSAWEARLQQMGVAIEASKKWKEGGRSLYFRDPDQHLVELATPGTWPIY